MLRAISITATRQFTRNDMVARSVINQIKVAPRYNAVVGVHDIGPRCKRGALGVPVSATLSNIELNKIHVCGIIEYK